MACSSAPAHLLRSRPRAQLLGPARRCLPLAPLGHTRLFSMTPSVQDVSTSNGSGKPVVLLMDEIKLAGDLLRDLSQKWEVQVRATRIFLLDGGSELIIDVRAVSRSLRQTGANSSTTAERSTGTRRGSTGISKVPRPRLVLAVRRSTAAGSNHTLPQVTGLFDAELVAALPDSLKFIAHNGAGYDRSSLPPANSAFTPPLDCRLTCPCGRNRD